MAFWALPFGPGCSWLRFRSVRQAGLLRTLHIPNKGSALDPVAYRPVTKEIAHVVRFPETCAYVARQKQSKTLTLYD